MEIDMPETTFTIMVAVAVFIACWAASMAISSQPSMEARLKALRTRRMKTRSAQDMSSTSSSRQTSISLMRKVAARLNLLRGAAADKTARRLRRAGFLSRDAAVVYVFLKLVLPLVLGFLMIFLTSVTNVLQVSEGLVMPICIGAVLAGFILPEVYVKNATTRRRELLNYFLPEGLDLLTICVEAGLSIDAAFRRVSREMQRSMPELAVEFDTTATELTYLPDRQQALENMVERSDSPAISALVNALRQTEKYGTPLAASLRILSQEFRQTRASKAEEKGARMPALMTVPMMIFILPTLVAVLLAPAIMSAFSLT